MLWGHLKYAQEPGTRLRSEQSPPHQSASRCKGSRLFGQGAAGFAQKKASAVPLMPLVNCGKRRKHISTHLVLDVSLPFMRLNFCPTPNICVVVRVTSFVSGNFHSACESYWLAKFRKIREFSLSNWWHSYSKAKGKDKLNEIFPSAERRKGTLVITKMTLNWLSHFPRCSYSLSPPVFTQTSSNRDLWKSNQAKMLNYGKEWKYLPE